jgi:hypothetical protein
MSNIVSDGNVAPCTKSTMRSGGYLSAPPCLFRTCSVIPGSDGIMNVSVTI